MSSSHYSTRQSPRQSLRLPDTTQRTHSREHFQRLLRLAIVEEIRARGTRGHGVDRDALGCKVLAHDARHLLDGTFGGGVEEVWGLN